MRLRREPEFDAELPSEEGELAREIFFDIPRYVSTLEQMKLVGDRISHRLVPSTAGKQDSGRVLRGMDIGLFSMLAKRAIDTTIPQIPENLAILLFKYRKLKTDASSRCSLLLTDLTSAFDDVRGRVSIQSIKKDDPLLKRLFTYSLPNHGLNSYEDLTALLKMVNVQSWPIGGWKSLMLDSRDELALTLSRQPVMPKRSYAPQGERRCALEIREGVDGEIKDVIAPEGRVKGLGEFQQLVLYCMIMLCPSRSSSTQLADLLETATSETVSEIRVIQAMDRLKNHPQIGKYIVLSGRSRKGGYGICEIL